MLVLVGTMPSLASLVSLGSISVTGTTSSCSESSCCSLVRRVSLTKRNFKGKKRWVCKYSVTTQTTTTTTDFIEQGNGSAVSFDSNTFRGSNSDNDSDGDDNGIVLKPAPRPLLKSSGAKGGASVSGVDSVGWDPSRVAEDSDLVEKERNKVIESLDEVLEKAEKLETRKESGNVSVNKVTPPKVSTNTRNGRPVNSVGAKKSKTLKSVWKKGDSVASVQKVVKETPKTGIKKEEPKMGGDVKLESQVNVPVRPVQPPLRPQPKLQTKPSVAPPPAIKKPIVLNDVGAAQKLSNINEADSAVKSKERKPILIDKFASKKPAVDPLISQAVLAPTKPGKGPAPGKFKEDYRKKGGPRKRIVDDDDDIPDEEASELIPGAARKGRKWTKASRKAAKLKAAKDAAPVKVEILEVGEKGMLIEELAYNLAIGEGEILGSLYSKGIKPEGVQTLDKDMVKMICKDYEVEVLDADPVKMEEMARKKEIFDKEDLNKLEDRPPVLTIMGHVDHGKVSFIHSANLQFIRSCASF